MITEALGRWYSVAITPRLQLRSLSLIRLEAISVPMGGLLKA